MTIQKGSQGSWCPQNWNRGWAEPMQNKSANKIYYVIYVVHRLSKPSTAEQICGSKSIITCLFCHLLFL